MAAITTIRGHVSRAIDFFNHNDIYFCIGQSTEWEDENAPPLPLITVEDVPEIIGFKKVEHKYMVVQDEAGEIYYIDSRWRVVAADQAVLESARWVYIDTNIAYDELPLSPYRVIGIYSGTTKEVDVPSNKTALIPVEVATNGNLEVIDNRKVVTRQPDQKELLTIILEF